MVDVYLYESSLAIFKTALTLICIRKSLLLRGLFLWDEKFKARKKPITTMSLVL
jgi:hypothetical protein